MSTEVKEANIQISGMTCAACAAGIEKGLNKMEGVEQANVNLALEKSSGKYDPSKLSEADLEKKIEALGYGVVKDKAEFDITGMTCANCSLGIEKGLNKMEGISAATDNVALEKATNELNPAEVAIADNMAKAGNPCYGAHQKQEEKKQVDHREKAIQEQKRKLSISAILSLRLLWTMVSHFSFTSF